MHLTRFTNDRSPTESNCFALFCDESFQEKELTSAAPAYQTNRGFIQSNTQYCWKITRCWQLLLLGEYSETKLTKIVATPKKLNNHGFKIIDNPDRIIVKDAQRIFNSQEYRQLIVSLLSGVKKELSDYQQSIGYVLAIIMIFYPPSKAFEMTMVLEKSFHYNLGGMYYMYSICIVFFCEN